MNHDEREALREEAYRKPIANGVGMLITAAIKAIIEAIQRRKK